MSTAPLPTGPMWSTSAFSDETQPTALELAALQDHLTVCNGQTSRLFRLHCGADALHRLLAGRFATVALAVAVALAAWLA